ncbi:cytochrome P450 [Kutzneria viridogrisea]|uniref:Cytochrome P450 n=2 Tax=Kutzneria TaxID=43356 RepID=W5WF44_9PSEU|nr:hypothetical protein KALB_6464 [Kutzneria albida DSM 43870]
MLFDSQYFTDPHPVHARLREAGPAHLVTTPDGKPAWIVTGEADVRRLLADPRLSVNKRHGNQGYAGFSLPPALDANLLNIDAEDHSRLRRLVAKVFTARRVEDMRARVQQIADELVDRLDGPEVDLAVAYADPLPLTVVGDLLGVPEADRRPFSAWTTAMLSPAYPAQVAESVVNIHRFLVDLVAARRAEPGTDLLSALITARDEDDRLSEDELVSLAFLLLFAGAENSAHLISTGVLELLRRPALLAELRAGQVELPAVVEELLRLEHANQFAIRRFPLEDLRIGEVTIPAGDTVLLDLASANRDPNRFERPEELDPARADKAHLAFGHGPHFCLGAALARMEGQIGIGTLLRRLPDLALAVPVAELRWRPSFRSHSLAALPVRI